jgi:hypothetical protein
MKRLCIVFVGLALTAAPASAHFIWLVPSEPDAGPNSVHMVFSDNLLPDPNPELLNKIAQTVLERRGSNGLPQAIRYTKGKQAFEVPVPEKGVHLVTGVCKYGVFQRGDNDPMLLNYYPKTIVGLPLRGESPDLLSRTTETLPLEIVPVLGKGERAVRVLWQGKPLEGAEVAVLLPGEGKKPLEGKTDKDGLFSLEKVELGGLFGIRARHTEPKEGELDGKKYKAIRHYATLTIPLAGIRPTVPTAAVEDRAVANKPPADPEATKLLAEARAARANWDNFPGFSADMEINSDGKVFKCPVQIDAKGEVHFKLADEAVSHWARRQLASLAGHRLDNSTDLHSSCAFADSVADHPLGRAIRVLDDEFHSSYRIRDRQVIVVNRSTKDSRFTITVLENKLNEENRYLPVAYIVNYWDLKSEELKRSDAHHHVWRRVGTFDLPALLTVVTALPGKQEARSIKLSNHHLLGQKGN